MAVGISLLIRTFNSEKILGVLLSKVRLAALLLIRERLGHLPLLYFTCKRHHSAVLSIIH